MGSMGPVVEVLQRAVLLAAAGPAAHSALADIFPDLFWTGKIFVVSPVNYNHIYTHYIIYYAICSWKF